MQALTDCQTKRLRESSFAQVNITMPSFKPEISTTFVTLPSLEWSNSSPFPYDALVQEADRYPNAKQFVWAQEEPLNLGAWQYVEPRAETGL